MRGKGICDTIPCEESAGVVKGREFTMQTQYKLRKAKKLLEASDHAFDRNDTRAGSRLIWEAAIAGVSAVAESRGWPHATIDDLKETIRRLDDMDDPAQTNGFHRYYLKFSVADMFRERAEIGDGNFEPEEFEWSEPETRTGRKSMKRFAAMLSELAESDGEDK